MQAKSIITKTFKTLMLTTLALIFLACGGGSKGSSKASIESQQSEKKKQNLISNQVNL